MPTTHPLNLSPSKSSTATWNKDSNDVPLERDLPINTQTIIVPAQTMTYDDSSPTGIKDAEFWWLYYRNWTIEQWIFQYFCNMFHLVTSVIDKIKIYSTWQFEINWIAYTNKYQWLCKSISRIYTLSKLRYLKTLVVAHTNTKYIISLLRGMLTSKRNLLKFFWFYRDISFTLFSKIYLHIFHMIAWLVGLGVWFSLQKREIPGSTPGQALLERHLHSLRRRLFFKSMGLLKEI